MESAKADISSQGKDLTTKSSHWQSRLRVWHASLEHDTGLRANLKRAKSIDEVLRVPQVYSTSLQVFGCKIDRRNDEQIAATLGLVAHIKKHEESNLPQKLAQGDPPQLNVARFQRLMQKSRHEVYVDMIRVLRLLKNEANLFDISRAMYYWGDRVKRDWMREYFCPPIP